MKNNTANPKNQTKIIFVVLGILFLIILLGKLFSIFSGFSQPLDKNFYQKSTFNWDSKTNINLLFANISDDPHYDIVTFNPIKKEITILNLSPEIYVNVPKNFGSWRLGSVYSLGEENSTPIGKSLLKLSASRLVGLPLDGLILTPQKVSTAELIGSFRSNPFSIIKNMSAINTDLTAAQTFKLFREFAGVRGDKLTSIDLSKSDITESKLLPDSTRVLGVNNVSLDVFVRSNMSDSTIEDESKSIAVINATTYPGLAQEVSRIITNMGGTVVITTSTDHLQKKSFVISSEEDPDNLTMNRLMQIYAPRCLLEECVFGSPEIISSRAQVNVVLGEDFYKLWNER